MSLGKNKLVSSAIKLAIISVVFVLLYKEFRHINIRELFGLLSRLSDWERGALLVMGLSAFMLIILYDFIMAKFFELKLSPKTIFKIGWISAAFNNLIGLGGLSGGTVRVKMYQDAGVEKEKSFDVSVSIWAATSLGLAFLMLVLSPFLTKFHYFYLLILVGLYVPFFLFGQYIPFFSDLPIVRNIFSVKSLSQRFILLAISSFEWLGASVFFGYLLRLYNPDITYPIAICTYIVAMIVGMISFLPGGLGSFELMCVLILGHFGYDTTSLAASILLYRLIYYIVPWVIGMLGILWGLVRSKLLLHQDTGFNGDLIIKGLYYSCSLISIIFLVGAVVPEYGEKFSEVTDLVYWQMDFWIRSVYFFIGVFMFAFSRGIRHRLKSAWWAMLVLFAFGAFVFIPNNLNVRSIVLYLAFVALLYFSRDYFDRERIPYQKHNFLVWATVLLGAPLVVSVVSFVLRNGIYHDKHFLQTVGHFVMEYHDLVLVYIIFALTTSFLIGIFVSKRIVPEATSQEDRTLFFELAETYGGTEFTHLGYLDDKNIFFNEKRTVAFLYRPYRSHILVLGDPIGKREDFEDALDEFENYVTEYNMALTFYEVSNKYLELYALEGYSFMKIGEEAVMDLENFTLVGKKYAYFRNIYNRMQAGMYDFKIESPEYREFFFQELNEVSELWLNKKKEKKFSVGYFDRDYLNQSLIATVHVDGLLEGFASLRPFYDKETLAVDLMRIRPHGANAVMDAIFLGVILWAKENGYKKFSLGMAPFANVGHKKYSKRKEKLLRYAFEFGNQIYGFKGLRKYKEKYRPQWENRYIVFRGEGRLPLVLLALAKTINTPK